MPLRKPAVHKTDPMTNKADQIAHPKDRDSVAMGEGMNNDFPTSPIQDRYKLASPFRVKAFKKGAAK